MIDHYQDLRQVIEHGFLSFKILINHRYIVFRSPTLKDFELIESYSIKAMRDVILISRCIYSIGYVKINQDRDFYQMINFCKTIPLACFNKIVYYLYSITNRLRNAGTLLEGFCYETESRQLWKTWLSKNKFHKPVLDREVDLDVLQIAWIIWNEGEDLKHIDDAQWQRSLFVASAMASGVDKIKTKWKNQEELENKRREQVKKYARMGKIMPKEHGMVMLDENEKLIEDMRKWLAGEEDEHDRAIREYKEDMKQQVLKARTFAEEQRQIAIQRQEEIQAVPLVGYSLDEIKQKAINLPNTIDVNMANDPNNVLNKFMLADVVPPEPLNNDQNSIFNQSKTSLMDKIAQRQPKI
jgi:hypothetical protein